MNQVPDAGMDQVPVAGIDRVAGSLERFPADGGPSGQVDRFKSRGLELTPRERRQRRSNRRWMLGISVGSVAILVAALAASAAFQSNQPNGPSIKAPAGYKAVRDGYFSYAVPVSWANNPAFTDQAGDVDTSGPSGFAAEHIGYRFTPPVLGEPRPASLEAFGQAHPGPYRLTGGHAVSIVGSATSFAYEAVRPNGFRARVIDAWDAKDGVELWLMIQAPPAVADQIVSSLRA